MAIAYTGVNVNDLYIGVTTRTQVVNDIKTSLVSAGWTAVAVNANNAIIDLVPGSNPSNGQTVTLDGRVYTFKTVINNLVADEVLIGSDMNASFTNLKKAINLESGAGTNYSSATTANLTVKVPVNPAIISTDSILIEQLAAGAPTGIAVSTNVTNWVWATTLIQTATLSIDEGYNLTSAVTAQFQQFQIYVFNRNDTNTQVRICVRNTEQTEQSHGAGNGFLLFGDAVTDIRVIANPYQCFIMVDGVTTATPNRFFAAGVPQIPTFLVGKEITGATNASPIVITTASAHGYTTGDTVTIRRVLGNLAANVTNNAITVLTPTTFSLDGVAGNAAYISGGVAAYTGPLVTSRQIAEAIWAQGGANNLATFRANLGGCGNVFCALNGSYFSGSSIAGGNGNLQVLSPTWPNFLNTLVQWFNSSLFVSEPVIAFGQSNGGIGYVLGQLWDAVVVMSGLQPDLAGGGTFDGHNWWGITANNAGSISLAPGSLLVVVP